MLTLHEKYIIDEKGKKTAAVLPYVEWKKLMIILEEYEEICAYDKAKSRVSQPISFKSVSRS